MNSGEAIARAIFIGTLSTWMLALLNGWFFMLIVGAIHAEWIPQLPTIGYWWSVLIVAVLRTVFGPMKVTTNG